MADVTLSTSTLSNMFKVLYDKKSYAVFNTATPLWSKIKKEHGRFKGKSLSIEAILGYSGSVGSGTLPETNVFEDVNASLTRKKLYARVSLDRDAMIASKGKEAAFEEATERAVRKGVESFMRNASRQLFALEPGKIFESDGTTNVTVSGADYTITGLASSYVNAFIEKKDYLISSSTPFSALETASWEVKSVVHSTRVVVLTLRSGSTTMTNGAASTVKFYMQGSRTSAMASNDLVGILEAAKATSGTLYGVTVGNRFQAGQVNANSAGITTDLVNQIVTEVEFKSGESPDMLVTSFKQYRKFQDLLGDRVRYMAVQNRSPVFRKPEFNFEGIQWMTGNGPIPLVPDRMCPDDHLFALNTDNISLITAQAPKWADEDGTVLLRSSTADSYEARYMMYGELFVHPEAQGVLYGLG